MSIGLMHLHRTLAYLLFLVALADLILALTKGRSDPGFAKVLRLTHGAGLLWGGRITLIAGIVLGALWQAEGKYVQPLFWTAILLWAPIEVLGKRLVKPEVALAEEGGTASGRLVTGTAAQLLLIAVIFGLMSAM